MVVIDEAASAYQGRAVAVTGASGYVGAELAASLQQAGARLLTVSRRPRPAVPGVETLVGHVRERHCWDRILQSAEVVFHLAGPTSVYAAAADPADSFSATVLPAAHLIAAAQQSRRRPRVVYASTATVYGLTDALPVAEAVAPSPVTIYDLHKWFAEEQLALAAQCGILEAVSLRLPNVYGPSAGLSAADNRGVLNAVARLAVSGAPVLLYGDGRYLRDYVYIDDVVRAFLIAGSQPGLTRDTFNVASGRGIAIRDAFHLVVERAAHITGATSDVREVPWPPDADPIEFRNFVADIGRIASVCGWAPRVSLVEGVEALIRTVAG